MDGRFAHRPYGQSVAKSLGLAGLEVAGLPAAGALGKKLGRGGAHGGCGVEGGGVAALAANGVVKTVVHYLPQETTSSRTNAVPLATNPIFRAAA